MMHPSLRRSGRTERMLREVAEDVKSGKQVIVLAANEANYLDMAFRLADLLPGSERLQVGNGIRTWIGYPGSGGALLISYSNALVDIKSGRSQGKDAIVYADHLVAELAFGWLLEEWLRYSVPSLTHPFADVEVRP